MANQYAEKSTHTLKKHHSLKKKTFCAYSEQHYLSNVCFKCMYAMRILMDTIIMHILVEITKTCV